MSRAIEAGIADSGISRSDASFAAVTDPSVGGNSVGTVGISVSRAIEAGICESEIMPVSSENDVAPPSRLPRANTRIWAVPIQGPAPSLPPPRQRNPTGPSVARLKITALDTASYWS